ncbi:MAG: serine hydrolase [Candidatus Falkowbacteria bacterium]
MDYNPGWETIYEIKAGDKREGGKIYLFTGDEVKIKDLFYFSLVGSDNTATAALVSSTGLTEEEFVAKVNIKIKGLGFKNTRIADVVGLKDGNISTAREVAQFANIALGVEEISRASLTKKYEFTTKQGRKKSIISTNELLNIFPEQKISLLGGKTGYTNSSGYCLVSKFKGADGRLIVTVVLGADSEISRFGLTRKLVDLYYNNEP